MSQPRMRTPVETRLPSLSNRIDLESPDRARRDPVAGELICDCGSISAAGRAMNMSYRKAWALVGDMNRMCRRDIVERQVGGKNGGGTVLTVKSCKPQKAWAREEPLALQADIDA
jgi:molybdate transport system regulatory protein